MPAPARVLLAAAAAGVLLAAFSCKTFDLPNETCDPAHFHGGMLIGAASDSDCNRCLESQCCEQVGICERSTDCSAVVSSVHRCVIEAGLAGAHDETSCADRHGLKSAAGAEDAYRCMRDGCGIQCGLPVCKVDPAALLVQTPACDACFASSCCSQVNACYASRACKLTIECIIKECGAELGASLSGPPFPIPPGGGDAAAFDVCAEAGAPNGPSASAPGCVRKCLCDFKDNDQGLTPSNDALRPPMLALAVYTCGQAAGCGAACSPATGSPSDAGTSSDSAAAPDAP